MRFDQQVVLITGASGQVGPSVVRAFAREGAKVVGVARRAELLPPVFQAAELPAGRTLALAADVTRAEQVERVVSQSLERFGRIDVLVNLVGGYRAGQAVWEMTDSDLDAMFDLNARSVFLMCRAVVPVMRAQRSGKVVNVGAKAGLQAGRKASAYAMSKSAVLRLTESLALEGRDDGINVNAVVPGTIDTPANRAAFPKADPKAWVSPEALAEVIAFLSSSQASAMHGTLVPVPGPG